MELTENDIGQYVEFNSSRDEKGVLLGFYVKFDKRRGGIVLRKDNGETSVCHANMPGWRVTSRVTNTLPPEIECLMREFGSHEKQTRALVAAILKLIKEK